MKATRCTVSQARPH